MATMPAQRPGQSEQVVCTPPKFLKAVKDRLGIEDFDIDLAASRVNRVTERFYSEEEDSLLQMWHVGDGWNWLNPPFSDLAPWVSKGCSSIDTGARTAMLVPASTGSNWWNAYVDGCAYVTFLNGRITFVGHKSPYPKDLALLLYAPFLAGGSCVWRWK